MGRDHDLLFGEIALQLKLLDEERLAEASAASNASECATLADVLLERGWISLQDKERIERIVAERLLDQGGRTLLEATEAPALSDDGLAATLNESARPSADAGATLSFEEHSYARVEEMPILEQMRSHYSLDRVHAVGGLGRVFVARDENLNREVALKEIRPEHAGLSDVRRRFLREAQITGQLEHPNIVPVHELVECSEGESPFYTMRFVRGETLRQAIRKHHETSQKGQAGRMDRQRLLQAFLDVCNAVAYAHSRGVIHRDLKPENILLGSFGEVILLDWGLAKMIDEPETAAIELSTSADVQKTRGGNLLGTPAYMAPEQAAGRLDEIDQKTDVYGLGAILFEILTGRAPHAGHETNQVIQYVLDGPTPRVADTRASAPRALDAVCAKAMAKQRDDRYVSAAELVEDVRRYLGDEEISALPDSPLQKLGRWARHNRTWAMAAFLLLAAAALTASVAGILLARSANQKEQALLMTNRLREDSARVTSWFAAKAIAGEIDQRWRILETRAADPKLRKWLSALQSPDRPDNPDQLRVWLNEQPAFKSLKRWIERHHEECTETTKSSAWLLFDGKGIQVARHPFLPKMIGVNFVFRDYFQGIGYDLDPKKANAETHIIDAHLSIVIQAKGTGHRMVVFSVPVWGEPSDDGAAAFLGVLAMAVELGHFRELQVGLTDNQIAVLADTRRDDVEDAPRTGLLLHHPELARLREEGQGEEGTLPVYRLTPERVETLRHLCRQRMKESATMAKMSWREQLTIRERPAEGSLVHDYESPVGGKYAGKWIAAFEPVLVEGRSDRVKSTGWVIIIQERKGKSLE